MYQFTIKQWETQWNGHSIVVENWENLLDGTGVRLCIDGDLVCEPNSIWNITSRILEAEIHDETGAHQVRVQFAPAIGFRVKISCQIFLDDEWIGGDEDKKSAVPSVNQLPVTQQRKQLKRELLYLGVAMPTVPVLLHELRIYFLHDYEFF